MLKKIEKHRGKCGQLVKQVGVMEEALVGGARLGFLDVAHIHALYHLPDVSSATVIIRPGITFYPHARGLFHVLDHLMMLEHTNLDITLEVLGEMAGARWIRGMIIRVFRKASIVLFLMINEPQWTGSLQLQMRMLGLHQGPYLSPHLISLDPVLDHDLAAEWWGALLIKISHSMVVLLGPGPGLVWYFEIFKTSICLGIVMSTSCYLRYFCLFGH